jgi:hypothetical protein
MKAITRRSAFVTAAVCAALLVVPGVAQTPAKKVTALVGGTLIDGYGGRPLTTAWSSSKANGSAPCAPSRRCRCPEVPR